MFNSEILITPIEDFGNGYQYLYLTSDGTVWGQGNYYQAIELAKESHDKYVIKKKVKMVEIEEFLEYVEWYREVYKNLLYSVRNTVLFNAKQLNENSFKERKFNSIDKEYE